MTKNGPEDVQKYRFRLQKAVKTPNHFPDFENMYFHLSNALSNVFICYLEPKIERSKNMHLGSLRPPPKKTLTC